jgi:hypothetical protein
MLAGTSAADALRKDGSISALLLGQALKLVVTIDHQRTGASESPALVAANRSITTAIQRLIAITFSRSWRSYPDYLVFAETNLHSRGSAASSYDAVVKMRNGSQCFGAREQRRAPTYVSVQVETAWGKLGQQGPSASIGTCAIFVRQCSACPHIHIWVDSRPRPDTTSSTHYARPRGSRALPVMVVEGGWASRSVGGVFRHQERCRPTTSRGAAARGGQSIAVFQPRYRPDLRFPKPVPGILAFSTHLVWSCNLDPSRRSTPGTGILREGPALGSVGHRLTGKAAARNRP